MSTIPVSGGANPRKNLTLLLLASLFAAPLSLAQTASSTASTGPCLSDTPSSADVSAFTYDVASIRPHPAGDGSLSFSDSPRAASATLKGMTMKNIIEVAYGVSDYQVSGGPAWLDTDHFDIEAKSDSSVNDQLARLSGCDPRRAKQHMLQALLADRVKLTVRRGSKEVTGYDLVVAKNGPRLDESKPAADDASPGEPNEPHGGGMTMYARRQGYEIVAKAYSMTMLSAQLSSDVHGPVLDKTGLTALYDFRLQYTSSEVSASSAGQDAAWPSIFTALQEQLGLKLQPAKVPVDTIFVDHIEEPSQN